MSRSAASGAYEAANDPARELSRGTSDQIVSPRDQGVEPDHGGSGWTVVNDPRIVTTGARVVHYGRGRATFHER